MGAGRENERSSFSACIQLSFSHRLPSELLCLLVSRTGWFERNPLPLRRTLYPPLLSLSLSSQLRALLEEVLLASCSAAMAAISLQNIVLLVLASVLFTLSVNANDPENLQDICVADLNSTVKVNGFVCKAADMETADDFSSSFIAKPGNITSKLGALVTLANVAKFPGLNTFGISMARIDYKANGGLNPPHVHPRASELLFLEKGTLYVGFVTTENKLFAKTIHQGDLFLFPKGLIHFQLNVGDEAAVGIAALTSQNPGTSQVARATFASMPAIESAVLSTAFQISDGEVKHLMEVIKKT